MNERGLPSAESAGRNDTGFFVPAAARPRPAGSDVDATAFGTTHWSLVLTAANPGSPQSADALEKLCCRYWRPLYAWLRRSNSSLNRPAAEDHIQGFFADLFERVALARINPQMGKFRSFLLASLKNYLSNERVRANAQKRGGRFEFVSWDDAEVEHSYLDRTSYGLPPDSAFEQNWALELLEHTLARLRDDQAAAGRSAQFEVLQVYLTGDRGAVPYGEAAARLQLSESAVKMAIQRLRRRFGEMLRAEIAQTVVGPEEVDGEIRALFAAVSRHENGGSERNG